MSREPGAAPDAEETGAGAVVGDADVASIGADPSAGMPAGKTVGAGAGSIADGDAVVSAAATATAGAGGDRPQATSASASKDDLTAPETRTGRSLRGRAEQWNRRDMERPWKPNGNERHG
jgi:hypothetical protein